MTEALCCRSSQRMLDVLLMRCHGGRRRLLGKAWSQYSNLYPRLASQQILDTGLGHLLAGDDQASSNCTPAIPCHNVTFFPHSPAFEKLVK